MHAPELTHPAVRDLAWALGSPPLLLRRDSGVQWPADDWYAGLQSGLRRELRELDAAPGPLLDRLARSPDRRLGRYFETLWQYWLDHDPRYRLLFANLPVRAAGSTLGEFDLIVADHHSGSIQHWEIALKFYLGQGDTTQPGNWWGTARRDRLDIKTARLLQHQSRLSQRPEARALLKSHGIRIDERRVILKGRLFYPFGSPEQPPHGSNPAHLRGRWLPGGRLATLPAGDWQVLEKSQWLAPLSAAAGPLLSTAALSDWWQARSRRPVCVAAVNNGAESERLFVVPDDWGKASEQPC